MSNGALRRHIFDHDPLQVTTFTDTDTERWGHPVRSAYTEMFWLPIIGPTTSWLLRRLQVGDVVVPVPLGLLSLSMGVGVAGGINAPVIRSLSRLVEYGLAVVDEDRFSVTTHVPRLSAKQLVRLPGPFRQQHEMYERAVRA